MSNTPAILANHARTVAAIERSVSAAESIDDLHEARARVEAIKAWAKVHKQTKSLRLDLLRLEVAALVRIVELGGIDTLPAADRKAARWLADMTPEARAALIATSRNATTAAGMCRSIWADDELRSFRQAQRDRGRTFAADPPSPNNEDDLARASRQVNIVAALRSVITDRIADGVPFEASDLASEVLDEVGRGESWIEDEGVVAGVKEVTREAIRRQPVLLLDGMVIPRTLTALLDDGKYIRVPTENASVAHLDSAIALRAEQIEADRAALAKLQDFRRRIGAQPAERKIGAILADSLRRAEAAS